MKKSLADFTPATEDKAPESLKSFGAFKSFEDGQATIDLDVLRKYNIFFATPCYGGMVTDQFFLSMFRVSQALMRYGINFRITTLRNESLISRARNILTAMFLDSDCTHLMFIDADIEFQAEDVIRALAYDKPIVAGAYPKKTLPVQYAINFKFIDAAKKQVRVENGLVEVLDASTGFFLVQREVIEKMIAAYPELHYRNDSNIDPKLNKYCYNLWDVRLDPHDNRLLSEDYSFCRRFQQLGGEIWLDPNTKLNHVGSYTFEGNVSQILGSN
jgi:hypothetical protein